MDALFLIDLQNDYLPGGALAVPHGHEVLPVAYHLAPLFGCHIASQDWHPPNHISFASSHPGRNPGEIVIVDGVRQVLQPTHCVQGTHGAALSGVLDRIPITKLVLKGTNPATDSWSAFFDHVGNPTELGDYLRGAQIHKLFVMGLATETCVKATVLDARRLDFEVVLVMNGCRAYGREEHDESEAIDAMVAAGAKPATSEQIRKAPWKIEQPPFPTRIPFPGLSLGEPRS